MTADESPAVPAGPDATEALRRLARMAASGSGLHTSGEVQDAYEIVRAALTAVPAVPGGRTRTAQEVLDEQGRKRARFGVLSQDRNGLWAAATVSAYGALATEVLIEHASRQHAAALVERWAESNGAFRRSAAWRQARVRASDSQIEMARKLGIENPEGYTKGGISDAMDVVRASRQLDRKPA